MIKYLELHILLIRADLLFFQLILATKFIQLIMATKFILLI